MAEEEEAVAAAAPIIVVHGVFLQQDLDTTTFHLAGLNLCLLLRKCPA